MGYKNVCLNCKRVENLGTDFNKFKTRKCPISETDMIFVNQKFRPPKKTDKKGWQLAAFLIHHGFVFQRITDENQAYLSYPKSMEEAKLFVEKYKHKVKK
ncbi:hypothetical protein [Persicobacter diffluens]|uniref:Uncharacterized protein n=1 Tax=Persicobacter diffluens TaxID=981 RepID=A0AAN5AM09_9BACT|nr:hypothetical protein PEDI_44460 [Persicobacter diffluens]